MPDEIERTDGLDALPKDRLAKLSNARGLNVALSGFAIAAAVAFGFGGAQLRLPAAIALALLPGVLIFLVHRDPLVYAISKLKGDPRTDLFAAFVVCGVGLVLGNGDVHFVAISTLIGYAVLVGALCSVGILSSVRQNSQLFSALVSALVLGAAYGWGLAAAVDTLPDESKPTSYTTTLQDKREAHGRGTSYYLYLAPWGPIEGIDRVQVSRSTYESSWIEAPVCLELRPGLLHEQWYRLVRCDGRTGPQMY